MLTLLPLLHPKQLQPVKFLPGIGERLLALVGIPILCFFFAIFVLSLFIFDVPLILDASALELCYVMLCYVMVHNDRSEIACFVPLQLVRDLLLCV